MPLVKKVSELLGLRGSKPSGPNKKAPAKPPKSKKESRADTKASAASSSTQNKTETTTEGEEPKIETNLLKLVGSSPRRHKALKEEVRETVESFKQFLVENRFGLMSEFPEASEDAKRILLLASQPDKVETDDLIDAIQGEPKVGAEVLRVANMPVYKAVTEITSPREAVVRLGLPETSRIAASTASNILMMPKQEQWIDAAPKVWHQHWHHPIMSSFGARHLAETLAPSLAGQAFVGGLFLNVGKIHLFSLLCHLKEIGEMDDKIKEEVQERACFELESAFGSELIRHWQLPDFFLPTFEMLSVRRLPKDAPYRLGHILRIAIGLNAVRGRLRLFPEQISWISNSIEAMEVGKEPLRATLKEMQTLKAKVNAVISAGLAYEEEEEDEEPSE
jgi:HD-like signal output (HDOD) protein